MVRNKVPEINKRPDYRRFKYPAKEFGIYPGGIGKTKNSPSVFSLQTATHLRPHVRVTVAPIYWTVVWSQLSLVGISQRLYYLYYCTRDA